MHGMRKDPQATGPLHGGVTIGRLMAGVDYSRPLRPKWSGTAGISFQVRVSFLVQILDSHFTCSGFCYFHQAPPQKSDVLGKYKFFSSELELEMNMD